MLIDDIESAIRKNPGLTATQLSTGLFGVEGYGERVNGACRMLLRRQRIERHGAGGPGHPLKYYPASIA